MFFYLAKAYAFIYFVVQKWFGINLRGLGFALRLVRADRVISVMGIKMFFNHKVAASYARPIIGGWNEPETHALLNYVLSGLPGSVEFVDVGANVGEMVLDVSQYKNVARIVAFEPIAECAHAITKSLKINGLSKHAVVEKLVGEEHGWVSFSSYEKNSGGSSVFSESSLKSDSKVLMTKLDDAAIGIYEHLVLLIDVEGFEPSVMRGGGGFLKRSSR